MNRRHAIPASPGPGAAAVTEMALAVFRLNGVLLHWGDQLVAPLGLTSARWQMLGALAMADAPLTAPQVGDAMGVTRQGAQKQLNLLLEQELAEARPNPGHRRSPLYAPTPKGLALYRKADSLWAAHASELAARIPASQAIAASRTLDCMLRELQTAISSPEVES
jgi:DNA-binding MarR family transcriptional regulator